MLARSVEGCRVHVLFSAKPAQQRPRGFQRPSYPAVLPFQRRAAELIDLHTELRRRVLGGCALEPHIAPTSVTTDAVRFLQLWDYESSLSTQVRCTAGLLHTKGCSCTHMAAGLRVWRVSGGCDISTLHSSKAGSRDVGSVVDPSGTLVRVCIVFRHTIFHVRQWTC